MENFKIIDNIKETMGTTLPSMIRKSKKLLYCGIGYFLDSGYKHIQDEIIDIANNGADVRIIAGNLFIQKDGIPIINPNLDKDTYELLVNLYDNCNGKIQIRSIKEQFFHGKFFLGIGEEESYFIGGSSNMSFRAISSKGNIEYNFYTQEETDSEMIKQNKEWFIELWDKVAVPLSNDNIEEIRFLLNKLLFAIDVQEDIHEAGKSENKSKIEIQCEIINNILENIGFNTTRPIMNEVNKNKANDDFVWIIQYLYAHQKELETNSIDALIDSLCRSAREDKKVIIKKLQDTIDSIIFRDYYYDIMNHILKSNISKGIAIDYSTFLVDMVKVFDIYYNQYHNRAYRKGSHSGTGTTATKPTLNTATGNGMGKTFYAPKKVSENRIEYLFEAVRQIRGNFDDDWLFQYQSNDVNEILKKYNFFEKGAYIAHEAGMGKSPIMCKFIKEVHRQKRDTRILIAVPASLMRQWKNENLLNDFGIQSEIVDNNKLKNEGNAIWLNRRINIVSIDFLKNFLSNETDEIFIRAMSPDVLIVDEAHLLKNSDSERYAEISKLNSKFVLLASATPLQNSVKEFLSQLKLMDDSVDLSKDKDIAYIKSLKDKYLIRRTREHDLAEIKSIKQAIRNVEKILISTDSNFKDIYGEIEAKLKNGDLYYYKFLGELKGNGTRYKNIDTITSFMLLQQMTSSVSACINGLTNIKNKIQLILNQDLKSLSESDISEYDSKEERELLTLLYEKKSIITSTQLTKLKSDISFIDGYVNESTGKLYKNNKPIKNPKEKFFVDLMGGKLKETQVIVFVKYIDTGNTLKEILDDNGITSAFFEGSLSSKQRDDIVQAFKKNEIQILIATDSANAGLNLQSTNVLINYDLNWNPQIVEQRIGRIHRIGQKSNQVQILNLIMENTVDSRIEEIMSGKENIFTKLFATSDTILGKLAKSYFDGDIESLDLNFDDDEEYIEEIETIFEEDTQSTSKLNNDYYYMIEALREILMWIMNKYNMTYYTEDNEEYYLKLENGDIYIVNLNQVFNMIENEQAFFKDFNSSTPITNKKSKQLTTKIERFYLGRETQSNREIIEELKKGNASKELIDELNEILLESINKTVLLLNLNVEYSIKIEEEIFTRNEFKTIVITPNNNIHSKSDIVRLFYVVPTKPNGTVRIDTIDDGEKYIFMYNELLKYYLISEKQKEIINSSVSILDATYSIYNGTIIDMR